MINRNANDDINKLITNLDITPAMFHSARVKYNRIASCLMELSVDVDIYPQGSFRLGTVIRPRKKGQDTEFDLDVISQLKFEKNQTQPKIVKEKVGTLLEENNEFSQYLLPEDNRCWTLLYSTEGFRLDIVPAVHETNEYFTYLTSKGVDYEYAINAIAITHKENYLNYSWGQSNPRGYAAWFEKINEPYAQLSREEHRQFVLKENRTLYATIEEIPPLLDRSALQRVIQILKRHRDIYFDNASTNDETIWEKRPSSIIITTLCAEIAKNMTPTGDILYLLSIIAKELQEHAQLQQQNDSILFEAVRKRAFIRKNAERWSIKNPVNPDDDYTDFWTAEHAKLFFRWLDAVNKDFFIELNTDEKRHYAALKNAFGARYVESIMPESKSNLTTIITSGTKPYNYD